MKIHLLKKHGNLNSLSCANNPFTKGKAVDINTFINLNKDIKCKKCNNLIKNKHT